MNALTQRQKNQIASAPRNRKAAMTAAYHRQNAMLTTPKKQQQFKPPTPPRPKKRAAPMAAARPKATKLCNFLDPLCNVPAPSLSSVGNALPHTALATSDFKNSVTNQKLIVCSNVGASGTVGAIFEVDPTTGKLVGSAEILDIPTLSDADSAGGPSAARAMKFSVSLVNCTNNMHKEGRITQLHTSQRLPKLEKLPAGSSVGTYEWDFSGTISAIKSSPYRRRLEGKDLRSGQHIIGYPVDQTVYNGFSPFKGSLAMSFVSYLFTGSGDLAIAAGNGFHETPRPMSIVAFVIDPTTNLQEYSLTVRASYYARFPLATIPGHSMKEIPTAPASMINAVHDHVEQNAHDMMEMAEGGALVTIAPKMPDIVRTVGAGVQRAVQMGRGMFAGAAAEALPIAEEMMLFV